MFWSEIVYRLFYKFVSHLGDAAALGDLLAGGGAAGERVGVAGW